ncbi:MAG TPA: hypothetical protein PK389_00055, partial [Gammaproteobacteria bacterium]|nr:hypothetical protein [Gammaproteobacteria bacterium]
ANLEDVLYQFFKLYDNWSLELKMVGQREAELLKTIEAFDEKIESLDEVKEVIKESIQKEAKIALSVTVNTTATEVKKYCHAELDYLMQDLNRSLSYAKSVIPEIQEFERNYSLRLWAIIVLGIFLIGFAAGTGWISHTTVSIDALKEKIRLK